MKSMPPITAIIPALNEAPAIARVIEGLQAKTLMPLNRIIVVDNGSTDGTGVIACRAGASVVREARRGYGYACFAGVMAADDAALIVLLDGDAADDPCDLPRVVEPLLRGEADLAIGSRSLGWVEPGSMTAQQVLGNRLISWLIRRLYGVQLSDPGPLRAIRRQDLLRLDMRERTYGWSVEMVVKAARSGYRYREVPVRYRRRLGVSKVGGTPRGSLLAGWCMLQATLRYVHWMPGKHAALRPSRSSR
jgi:glycosyltransferase involved in cell wall biosynthesis